MRTIAIIMTAAVLVACNSGPGDTISLALNPIPERTSAATVVVSGSVTRSGGSTDVITVAVAGGRTLLRDSLVGMTSFSFSVRLNLNQENQLAITASDPSGVVAPPVIVAIAHDDVGPQVLGMTPPPKGTDVAIDTPIEINFAEPIVATAGAAITLRHNGALVSGSFTISADAKRITFTPDQPLRPNSVYELSFAGYEDQTGNPAGTNVQPCFVTTASGFIFASGIDTTDLLFERGSPDVGLQRADLRTMSFARQGTTLLSLIEFAGDRTFGVFDPTSAIAYVEIDSDQDSSTGFTSLRDTIFDPNFPELHSNIRVELIFGIEPAAELGDSAYIGRFTNPLEFEVLDVFIPGVCGRFFGFHTDAVLDSLDAGDFDYTVLAFAIGQTGDYVDPMPENGHLSADITVPAPAIPSYRTDWQRPARSGVRGSVVSLHDRFARITRRRR